MLLYVRHCTLPPMLPAPRHAAPETPERWSQSCAGFKHDCSPSFAVCSAGDCQSSSKGSGHEGYQASLGNRAAREGPDSAAQGSPDALSQQRRPEGSCCSSCQWLDAPTSARSSSCWHINLVLLQSANVQLTPVLTHGRAFHRDATFAQTAIQFAKCQTRVS